VKAVVDRDLCSGLLVDPVHVLVKGRPVTIVVVVTVSHKLKRTNYISFLKVKTFILSTLFSDHFVNITFNL
jgi:hypothetical protein